jgi:hypothetical protein
VIENSTGSGTLVSLFAGRADYVPKHVADKRHSDRGRLPNDEETVDRRSRGDSGNHGICGGHQQCR